MVVMIVPDSKIFFQITEINDAIHFLKALGKIHFQKTLFNFLERNTFFTNSLF